MTSSFKNALFCILCITGFTLSLSAQKVIILNDETKISIKSWEKFTLEKARKWIILDESEKRSGYIYLPYTDFVQVKSVSLKVFDANGKLINTFKQKDFRDISLSMGFEIDDLRMLYYEYDSPSYPFTMELEYKEIHKGIFALPEWTPITDFEHSLLKGSLEIECPKDNLVKYKSNQIADPQYTEEDGIVFLKWSIDKPIAGIPYEPYSPGIRHYVPYVSLAPNNFEMQGYEGNLESWGGLGEWYEKLLANRGELSASTIEMVHSNFDSISSPQRKTQKIYELMQSKTRYVSIQLGIGGWQPMEAKTVDDLGYGDCKALTNYMKSLLNVAGIKSYYSLVYSGEYETIDPSFPQKNFNHAVLAVPLDNDTIWLECTNQHAPFGVMSSSTIGKYSLIIDGNKSKLKKVKSIDNGTTNKLSTTLQLTPLETNEAQIDADIIFSDLMYFQGYNLSLLSEKELRTFFMDHFGKPSTKIHSIKITADKELITSSLDCKFLTSDFYKKTGNKLILNPNILQAQLPSLPYIKDRKKEIEISQPYNLTDTLKIKIPEGYTSSFIPEQQSLETIFGAYSVKYLVSDNTLTIVANRSLNSGIFPPEEYESLRKFLSDCNNLIKNSIVYTLSTEPNKSFETKLN